MTSPKPSYLEIKLTRGQVALVETHRYVEINAFKWNALWDEKGRCFYAVRTGRDKSGKRYKISMHREILGLKRGDPRKVDHRFHHTLDNREFINGEVNLRIATNKENGRNSRKYRSNVSGYKGVYFSKAMNKWGAQITIDGKHKHLGFFDTPELAYEAYCKAAIETYGEFACLD